MPEIREGGFIHPPGAGPPWEDAGGVASGVPGTAGGWDQGMGDTEPQEQDAAHKCVARLGLSLPKITLPPPQ